MSDTFNEYRWRSILRTWPDASYRVHCIIYDAVGDRWSAHAAEGGDLEFRRLLNPGDREVDIERLQVDFDYIGRFNTVTRSKIIRIESGRSIADLERMLKGERR